MIIVTYEASGDHTSDAGVMEYALGFVENANSNDMIRNISVSQGLIIDAFRVLIKQKKIDHHKICFKFEGEFIYPDEKARLSWWPLGFCDAHRGLLHELMRK